VVRGPAQTSEPIIQYLYQLVEAVAEGRLLIPRFQRPLVWDWERQAELLRSVRDGIPMGAVMIWRTSGKRISWLTRLAGHDLPQPKSDLPYEYLLDGLQRLSTLFAALRGVGKSDLEEDSELRNIGYDLEEQSFVQLDSIGAAPPVIPLSVLSDSVTLLRFQRAIKGPTADLWIERSDALARAFREYKVPVIPIVSEDFEVAARTFNLINSQGVRMGEADMIHALTWSETFELRDSIESMRSDLLQPIGWGEIDFESVLKVVKAEADLDLYEESVEQVSRVLRDDREALTRAFERLVKVAQLLRTRCGVLDWDLVPYSLQAVLLAEAFRCNPTIEVGSQLLSDWFWLTTYGEMFAGLSGYRLGLAVEAIRDTAIDGSLRWSGATSFKRRPLPVTSDFRAVRIKALGLMLARKQVHVTEGNEGEAFQTLAEYKRLALFQLIPRRLITKGSFSSPGNRVLCRPDDSAALRQRVLTGHMDDELRSRHAISDHARRAAIQGKWDDFVGERLAALQVDESDFVAEIVSRHPEIDDLSV
jgi:Protein of unknown function DUF262